MTLKDQSSINNCTYCTDLFFLETKEEVCLGLPHLLIDNCCINLSGLCSYAAMDTSEGSLCTGTGYSEGGFSFNQMI